ncbi:hypothetical protein [Streptomyces sp. NPDC046942]|uniref:hypothetical protein n=1 Tax=Streptomyces sp. NPDC046942 TaxID=3155137 RepID=UPI0033EAAD0C
MRFRKSIVAAAALSALVLAAGNASATTYTTWGPYDYIPGVTHCGATQTFDGDVYAQMCIDMVGGTNVEIEMHVTSHGSHSIWAAEWVNHNNGVYDDQTICTGDVRANDLGQGSSCLSPEVNHGQVYNQGQGYIVIDGQQTPNLYSPSIYA